jgi:hypothetical protein
MAGSDDAAHFESMQRLETELMSALAAGRSEVTITLDTMGWLGIVNEIKDRRPRNYSRLLADDAMERLNAAIDRIHEEANYIAASGPGMVSERIGTKKKTARQVASPELLRSMRERGDPNAR